MSKTRFSKSSFVEKKTEVKFINGWTIIKKNDNEVIAIKLKMYDKGLQKSRQMVADM